MVKVCTCDPTTKTTTSPHHWNDKKTNERQATIQHRPSRSPHLHHHHQEHHHRQDLGPDPATNNASSTTTVFVVVRNAGVIQLPTESTINRMETRQNEQTTDK